MYFFIFYFLSSFFFFFFFCKETQSWKSLKNVIKILLLFSLSVSIWYSWLEPFRYELWIAILVTCNVILFVVWWLDRKSPKGYYVLLKDSDEDAFTLLGKKQSKSIWFLARDGNGKKKIRHLSPGNPSMGHLC